MTDEEIMAHVKAAAFTPDLTKIQGTRKNGKPNYAGVIDVDDAFIDALATHIAALDHNDIHETFHRWTSDDETADAWHAVNQRLGRRPVFNDAMARFNANNTVINYLKSILPTQHDVVPDPGTISLDDKFVDDAVTHFASLSPQDAYKTVKLWVAAVGSHLEGITNPGQKIHPDVMVEFNCQLAKRPAFNEAMVRLRAVIRWPPDAKSPEH